MIDSIEQESKLPLNIIIVDDDETSLYIMKAALKRFVEKISIAKSGNDALTLLDVTPDIDVIITDIHMPNMSGIDLAIEIRKQCKDIFIVAATGNNGIESALACIKAGFYGVIKKPIDIGELYSLLSNIADRIKVDKEKRKHEMILLEYQKAIDSGYIVSKTNHNGVITYVNDIFCKISGYSKEELIGQKHSLIRHPHMQKKLYETLWYTILNKQIWKGKIFNKSKDGRTYIVDCSIIPILDENQDIIEFISINQDITEIMETHKKLANEQAKKLQYTKKHYDELINTKTTLLNLFSHELKTPLNAISNLSKILNRKVENAVKDTEKQNFKELLGHIVQNADQIETMISDIIDIMRLQTGKVALKHKQLLITSLIDDQLCTFKHNINITKDYCLLQSQIGCDQFYALKIFKNIISNAIKHAKDEILISYKEENGIFYASFQDNGNGFADINKAIELFGQCDDDFLKRESKGLGLGLYETKLCCELFGWTLNLSNNQIGANVTVSGNIKG